jgi:hypothetical protein
MKKIKLIFEKGGELILILNNQSIVTQNSLIEILPLESSALHTRWCGREFSVKIKTINKPPLEADTTTVSKFDVVYWRDWERPEEEADEAIGIFYGAEILRYHKGPIRVNVLGHVSYEQAELLEQIGLRIWKNGSGKVTLESYEDDE